MAVTVVLKVLIHDHEVVLLLAWILMVEMAVVEAMVSSRHGHLGALSLAEDELRLVNDATDWLGGGVGEEVVGSSVSLIGV